MTFKLPTGVRPARLVGDCRRLTAEEVPPVPVFGERQSVRGSFVIDAGLERWRVTPEGKIITYIRYRPSAEILAGAFPWLEIWADHEAMLRLVEERHKA